MNRLGDLKTYLPFAKNSFQQLISYKANVIMFMFGDGLMLAVTYYLWKAIYSSTSDKLLNGFTLNEMIIYVFISFLTALILAFTVTVIMFYKFFGFISIGRILIYFLSIILGVFINFYFSYIFGLLSFKITNMWGLSQIMGAIINLLSGMLIPISFFPLWAQKIVNFFPFSSTIYTPSMIFLGKINGNNIISSLALQMLWIIILFIISKWMWKKLIKSLTILGG